MKISIKPLVILAAVALFPMIGYRLWSNSVKTAIDSKLIKAGLAAPPSYFENYGVRRGDGNAYDLNDQLQAAFGNSSVSGLGRGNALRPNLLSTSFQSMRLLHRQAALSIIRRMGRRGYWNPQRPWIKSDVSFFGESSPLGDSGIRICDAIKQEVKSGDTITASQDIDVALRLLEFCRSEPTAYGQLYYNNLGSRILTMVVELAPYEMSDAKLLAKVYSASEQMRDGDLAISLKFDALRLNRYMSRSFNLNYVPEPAQKLQFQISEIARPIWTQELTDRFIAASTAAPLTDLVGEQRALNRYSTWLANAGCWSTIPRAEFTSLEVVRSMRKLRAQKEIVLCGLEAIRSRAEPNTARTRDEYGPATLHSSGTANDWTIDSVGPNGEDEKPTSNEPHSKRMSGLTWKFDGKTSALVN